MKSLKWAGPGKDSQMPLACKLATFLAFTLMVTELTVAAGITMRSAGIKTVSDILNYFNDKK